MRINVVWRAWYPSYIGMSDNLTRTFEQGVTQIDSKEQLDDFIESQEVSYGEQGGRFSILFAWAGGIREKDATYFTPKELQALYGD